MGESAVSARDYDLVVVGGGPGGSTLATLVAKAGHRVLLLEKERFPRHQLGESLLPATVHGICRMLGVFDEVNAAGFVRKAGAAFRWGRGDEIWSIAFSHAKKLEAVNANYAFQVERARFDELLLVNARKNGVDVREEHAARDVLVENGRVAGVVFEDRAGKTTRVTSRFVADASGHNSRIGAHVGERIFSKFFQNVALYGYFENAGRLPAPNQGLILAEAFSEGWMWYIPLSLEAPFLTSVGAVIAKEHAARLQGDKEAALRSIVELCPRVRGLLSGSRRVTHGMYGEIRTRKDWSYSTDRFWKPGMVLVGDAACFVDPILSSGVHLSTYSALLAARSINTSLSGTELAEGVVFDEFESRYRAEYDTFFQFLLAFYDMNHDREEYFWRARSVSGTSDRANEAFVRLLAGGITAPDLYYKSREGLGDVLQGIALELQRADSMEKRIELTALAGERLHGFGCGPKPLHAGAEDLRRVSWGREPNEADTPVVPDGLVPSADGLHWRSATEERTR
jgi:halogenation protein CepH